MKGDEGVGTGGLLTPPQITEFWPYSAGKAICMETL